MAVRKKLQKIGGSRGIIIDRDLLEALLPDGDLEQTVLIEVVGDALVVRRETSTPLTAAEVVAAVAPDSPVRDLTVLEQRLLEAVGQGPAHTSEVVRRIGDRSRPTVSLTLNQLLRDGFLTKVGRDWHLTQQGESWWVRPTVARYAGVGPAVKRVCVALEDGPATTAELVERLGLSTSAVARSLRLAMEAGLVERDDTLKGVGAPTHKLTEPNPAAG